MPDGLFALLCTTAVYLGMLFGSRVFIRKLLERQMYVVSSDSPDSSSAAPQGDEAPAVRHLNIETIDAARSSDDGETHRELAIKARRLLRQSCALDLVVLVAFALFVMGPLSEPPDWTVLTVYLLVPSAVRYLFYRRQYWVGGADPWKTHYYLGFNLPPAVTIPLWALHKVSSPLLQVPLRWIMLAILLYLGVTSSVSGQPWGWALVSVALGVAAADLSLWREVRRQSGLTLLLLRVFHKDDDSARSAVATFGGVLTAWSNFGAFFTVIDDVLLRFRHPLFSARNTLVLIGFYLYFAILDSNHQTMDVLDWVAVGAAGLAAWALDVRQVYRSAAALLVAGPADVSRVVEKSDPVRGLDLRFRSLEVPCLNNTWREAVTAVAGQAKVVLMDLRGYSPDREGCDVEVNLLFDAVPLRRIVFMIEPGNLDEIAELFQRCWRELSADSPNLQLSDPTVSVVAYPLDDETTKDRITEKQVLLEEVLFRTTGRTDQARPARA